MGNVEKIIAINNGWCKIISNDLTEYPLVSVLMPIYNRKSDVGRSIESINEQIYPNIELIIADDGSTDDLEEYLIALNNPVIKYYKCKHNFIDTLNTAYRLAKGKYITRLDAGDVINENNIYKQVAFLENNIDVEGCLIKNQKMHEMYSLGEVMKQQKQVDRSTCSASFMFKTRILKYFPNVIIYPEFSTGGEDQSFINTIVHILNKKVITILGGNMEYKSLPTSNPSKWKHDSRFQDIHLLECLYNKYNIS